MAADVLFKQGPLKEATKNNLQQAAGQDFEQCGPWSGGGIGNDFSERSFAYKKFFKRLRWIFSFITISYIGFGAGREKGGALRFGHDK